MSKNLTDRQLIDLCDVSVRPRRKGEIKVARKLIRTLIAAGYTLHISDGEIVQKYLTEQAALNTLFSVDEAGIYTNKEGCKSSFISLVMGNSAEELVSDYGESLEPVMEKFNAWVDKQVDAGKL